MNKKELQDGYAIFKQVFSSKMSWEQFCYKHLGNPNRDENISTIVDYEGDEARGTNSFMGCVICTEQREIKAVQSCDTAVAMQHRGKHIFSNLILRAIDYCQENEQAFIFGFPNQNSYPGFLKLGFKEIGQMDSYYRILHPTHLILKKVLHKNIKLSDFKECMKWEYKGLEYELSTECPLSDADIQIINQREKLFLKRSKEYYKWKLEYMQEGKIAYICVRDKGVLRAFFAFCKRRGESCELADWYIDCMDKSIIKSVTRIMKKYCDMISVMMVNPDSNESKLLKSAVYIKRKSTSPFLMFVTTNEISEELISKMETLKNWELRLIDTDYILNG